MAKTKNTTFAFVLNSRPNRFGRYAIYLRITKDRKFKTIKTPVEINPKYWRENGGKNETWVSESDPEHKSKNDILKNDLTKVKAIYQELRKTSTDTIENIIAAFRTGAGSATFFKIEEEGMTGFAAKRAQQIHDEGGIRNWKIYVTFLNKLACFLDTQHKKELLFAEITTEFVHDFYSYLGTISNERSNASAKLSLNYKATLMNKFKALMQLAIKEKKITADKDPFLFFEYKDENTTKEKLDETEIKALQALELEKDSLEWHSRNCFFFSFYCAGMRAADVLLLRWKNVEGGKLNYTMSKNGKLVIDRDIMPQAAAILDLYRSKDNNPGDYIFPLMSNSKDYSETLAQVELSMLPNDVKQKVFNEISSKNVLLNKGLKRIAKKAGISKKVTMHIARHSFANKAMKEGIKSSNIQGLLKHSSLSITEKYMGNFGNQEDNETLHKIFGNSKKAQLLKLIDSAKLSDEDINKLMASVLAVLDK